MPDLVHGTIARTREHCAPWKFRSAFGTLLHGFVLLGAFAALSACGGSAEERKMQHFERGVSLYNQGDAVKASLEFKNVLQIDGKHVESLYMLGRIAEENQNFEVAYREYSHAVRVDPAHFEARLRLGGIYLLGNRIEGAREMVGKVLEHDPKNAKALVLRGRIRARAEDFDGAMSDGRTALEIEQSDPEAIALVSGLLVQSDLNDEAISLLEEGIGLNPDNPDLRIRLAQLMLVRGDVKRTTELFEEIVVLKPNELEHRILLATLYVRMSALDRAEEILRVGVIRNPEDIPAKLALVSFLRDQRGNEVAEAELLNLVKEKPSQHELKFALAEFYLAEKKYERANETYRHVIELTGDGLQGDRARIGLARMLVDRKNFQDARALVAQVLTRNPHDSGALILDGIIALEGGDADTAVADAHAVLQNAPKSSEALRLLARAHLTNNRRHLAVDAMKRAVEANPDDVQARFEVAQLMVDAGQRDQAAEQYREILESRPNHAGALEQLTRVEIARRDWERAGAIAGKAKLAYPDAAWPYYYTGVISLSQGDYKTSVSDLETALSRASPGDSRVLLALVRSYVGNGQVASAISTLEERLLKSPNDLATRIMLGELLLRQGKELEAEKEFETAIGSNPESELPYLLLARRHWARGDTLQALQVYEQGLKATGGSTALLMELGVAYERSGDPERGIAILEQALEKEPQSQQAANNLALLLATYRQDPASLERAKTLAEGLQDAGNPAFADTLGWVYLRRGEVDAAMPLLERALSELPDSPEIHYHLGVAYEAKGKTESSRAHLERALASSASFPGIEDAKALLKALGDS